MPIHDWTRVDAAIFHDFYLSWTGSIARALNGGILDPDHYALVTNLTGRPAELIHSLSWQGPAAKLRDQGEAVEHADIGIAVRHTSNHKVVAMVEIVSPGNKSSRQGLRDFVRKAVEFLRGGIHLLILDLFPPSPRDPQGLPRLILDELFEAEFALSPERPLTLAAYVAGGRPEAFIEPTAVGAALIEMPLFLVPEVYVPLPLEATYQAAWEAVPGYWREVVARNGPVQTT